MLPSPCRFRAGEYLGCGVAYEVWQPSTLPQYRLRECFLRAAGAPQGKGNQLQSN